MTYRRGNAKLLGYVSQCPGQSFLFCLKAALPGIGSAGDRDAESAKRRGSGGVLCALRGP